MLTTRAKRAMAVAPRYGEDAGVDGSAVQNERQQTDPTASAKNAKTATKQAAPAPDDRDLDALVNDIENVSTTASSKPSKKKKKKKKKTKAAEGAEAARLAAAERLAPLGLVVAGAPRNGRADDAADGLSFDEIDTTLPNRVMGASPSIMAPDDDDYSRILREMLGEEADEDAPAPAAPPETSSYHRDVAGARAQIYVDRAEVPAFVDATADSVQIDDSSFLPDAIARPDATPSAPPDDNNEDEDSDTFYDAPGGIKSDLGDIVGYLNRVSHDPADDTAPTPVPPTPAPAPAAALNRRNDPGVAPRRAAEGLGNRQGVGFKTTSDPDRPKATAAARPKTSLATAAAAAACKPPAPAPTSETDKDAEIKKLYDEIARLKEAAATAQFGTSSGSNDAAPNGAGGSGGQKKKKKKKKK